MKKKTKKVAFGVYLSPLHATLLEELSIKTMTGKSDLLRFLLVKSLKNPAWVEKELQCPGLSDLVKEVKKNL